MTRILFVDDEPRILDGLRRMLHAQRREWEMVFAAGGPAALEAFGTGDFDVVVTDMRMPGMDGAALLEEVRARAPGTIRIVLSGYTDRDASARAAGVAHQFLMKPSSPDLLRDAINRASALRSQVGSGRMRGVLGSTRALPTVPRLYGQIVQALERSDGAIDEVSQLLCSDAAFSAKLLQLVNSSFFGSARRVSSIQTAVQLLGLNMVKHLVLSLEVFRALNDDERGASPSVEALHQHALAVARTAVRLFGRVADRDELYAVGLLHDIGKLVLATHLPDEWRAIQRTAGERGVPSFQVEEEAIGVTHAGVGAYLLELWHLPVPLVEAVAFHHAPRHSSSQGVDLIAAVHVADALVHATRPAAPPETLASLLDAEYVERLGIAEQVEGWRAVVAPCK